MVCEKKSEYEVVYLATMERGKDVIQVTFMDDPDYDLHYTVFRVFKTVSSEPEVIASLKTETLAWSVFLSFYRRPFIMNIHPTCVKRIVRELNRFSSICDGEVFIRSARIMTD
jgi:hypothetical protein